MQIAKPNYKTLIPRESEGLPTKESRELARRVSALSSRITLAARSQPYPPRERVPLGFWPNGFEMLESGEIELRDSCSMSSNGRMLRERIFGMTGGTLDIVTWGERPRMYTKDGEYVDKKSYSALYRCPRPHMHTRIADATAPAVLLDRELKIASPLLPGEGGMYAYWPDEKSHPTTWSSWLVKKPDHTMQRLMKQVLRKVCKYAAPTMTMMRGITLPSAAQAVAVEEIDQAIREWYTGEPLFHAMSNESDPEKIAYNLVTRHTPKQLAAVGLLLSHPLVGDPQGLVKQPPSTSARVVDSWRSLPGFSNRANSRYVLNALLHGSDRPKKFTATSGLWRALKETTSQTQETKFLYID